MFYSTGPGAPSYKTFWCKKLTISKLFMTIADGNVKLFGVFVAVKLYQATLIFLSKARSLPLSPTPERLTFLAKCLTSREKNCQGQTKDQALQDVYSQHSVLFLT